jgi:hypothetical protein
VNWVIDASRSYPEYDEWCFCKAIVDEFGKFKQADFSVSIMYEISPEDIIGIVHPNGQKEAEDWFQEHEESVKKLFEQE